MEVRIVVFWAGVGEVRPFPECLGHHCYVFHCDDKLVPPNIVKRKVLFVPVYTISELDYLIDTRAQVFCLSYSIDVSGLCEMTGEDCISVYWETHLESYGRPISHRCL